MNVLDLIKFCVENELPLTTPLGANSDDHVTPIVDADSTITEEEGKTYVMLYGADWSEERHFEPDELPDGHKPICAEYRERGLDCPCIPQAEQDRIAAALSRGDDPEDIIDPGWGPQ